MKWSYQELQQLSEAPEQFKTTLALADQLHKRKAEVLAASPVVVDGMFSHDHLGIIGYFKVQVTVTLPSTRSLKPTQVPLSFDVTEHYLSAHERYRLGDFEDTDVVIVLENDLLDLADVICDNILLQLPMQVLAPDEQTDQNMPDGNDWQVVSEGQSRQTKQQHEEVDPRLAKLKDFFAKNDQE